MYTDESTAATDAARSTGENHPGRELRSFSARAVVAGIGIVVVLEAIGELGHLRRRLDRAAATWLIGVVRRAERDTHDAEVSFLAHWLLRRT